MKLNILLLSFFTLVTHAFTGIAQQKGFASADSARIFTGFLSTTLSSDTTAVPVIAETPLFSNYNFSYKNRLDSIHTEIPLAYNEAVQKYIEIYTGRKDMMGKMLGLSEYYFPIFEHALKAFQVPQELKYLPIIESAMNSHAISRVGATGLWQFMFSTAKGYGLNIDNYVDERKDPIQASYAAAAYFKDAYEQLGDWLLAIAAYNCGTGNVNRAINKAHSRDFWEIRAYLPLETRNYVPAFIAAVYVMNYADKHEIKVQKSLFAIKTDTVQVNRVVSLADLASALSMEEEDLRALNPSYKKKIVNGSPGLPKRIIMPSVNLSSFAMIYEVLNNTHTDLTAKVILASNDDSRTSRRGVRAQKHKPDIVYHKVGPGQNLSTIADRYNVEVQDLKVWNNLKGNNIVPGQRLIVSKKTAAARQTETKSEKKYISYTRRNNGKLKTDVL
jgi:membrane-bound lytic murein transglycosylase D